MICANCQKEFEPVRATAKFCSLKCRVASHRGVSVTVSVTDKPLSVTNEALSVTKQKVSVTEPIKTVKQAEEAVRNVYTSKQQTSTGTHKLCPTHFVPMTTFGKCLQKGCKYA